MERPPEAPREKPHPARGTRIAPASVAQPMARLRRDPEGAAPDSPPAVWEAFAAQSAWKSWAIAGLLLALAIVGSAAVRLAGRPPEVVLIDAGGNATPVRRSLATDSLLHFIADHTRPPEVAVVRFTKEFLRLSLAWNSSTVDSDWSEALARMAPDLRRRAEAEAAGRRLVEAWRAAQRRTELVFEELFVEDRPAGQIAVRATVRRVVRPLVGGDGESADRLRVELVERPFIPTLDRPDGLEVVEWHLAALPPAPPAAAAPASGR